MVLRIKNGKRLKRWAKKKAKGVQESSKYWGKPYKTPEEKLVWEKATKEARLKALDVRARKEAKSKLAIKKSSGIGLFGKGVSFAGALGKGIAEYDISPSSDILGSLGGQPPRKRKKRRKKKR